MGGARDVARAALRFAKRRDARSRSRLLLAVQRALLPELRMVDAEVDWYRDPVFLRYLARFDELERFNAPRRWHLHQLGRLSLPVAGDTVECGVLQGAGSWLICRATRGSGKRHHVFDSFEGLSQPGEKDGDRWKAGALSCPLDEVQKNLAEFPDVAYYRGWIPQRFHEVAELRFSLVHVDVDLEQPTRDSLAFFYPRTNPGGIIVCDDYGSSICPGATAAVDAYLADKPEKMMSLSPGGGFLIRGTPSPASSLA